MCKGFHKKFGVEIWLKGMDLSLKKRLTIWVLIILLLLTGWRRIPDLVRQTISSIYYVTPSGRLYENVVSCNGTLHAAQQYQIVTDSPAAIKSLAVEMGDYVLSGQLLAELEPVQSGFSWMNTLPQNLQINMELISSILSVYGLEAVFKQTGILSASDIGEIFGEAASTVAISTVSEQEKDIRAPVSGVVTSVPLTVNQVAAAGDTVLMIADISSYKVLVSVREGDIYKIELGDLATVRGVGFAGKSYTGYVSKIYPTARKTISSTANETVVDVEITLECADDNIKPGFSAKVEITGGNQYQMLTVPYEAVRQDENNNEYVYTYENGRLRKRVIVTGTEMINEVEILEGIEENSIVIFNPDDVEGEGAMINIKGRADVD